MIFLLLCSLIFLLLFIFIYIILCKLKGKEFIHFLIITFLWFIIMYRISLKFAVIGYFIGFIVYFIYGLFKVRRNNYFRTYFGIPGSGKSTMGTYWAIETMKKNKRIEKNNIKRLKKGKTPIPTKKIYTCNLNVSGAISIEKKDINIHNKDLHDCLLEIDEAGLNYNNRNFSKNFTEDELKLFKYHRKLNIDIIIFSQSFEDMDKKLRDLSVELYFLKRSFIPLFIKSILIKKFIMIDKDTKQIQDGYKKVLFSGFYVFMPKTWKYFDTTETS